MSDLERGATVAVNREAVSCLIGALAEAHGILADVLAGKGCRIANLETYFAYCGEFCKEIGREHMTLDSTLQWLDEDMPKVELVL